MSAYPPNEFAKARLMEFAALEMEQQMTFTCELNKGRDIVQVMRVRISRLKSAARRRNRTLKAFKLRVLSVIKISETEERVTIIKTNNSITDLTDNLDKELNDFEGLIGGGLING